MIWFCRACGEQLGDYGGHWKPHTHEYTCETSERVAAERNLNFSQITPTTPVWEEIERLSWSGTIWLLGYQLSKRLESRRTKQEFRFFSISANKKSVKRIRTSRSVFDNLLPRQLKVNHKTTFSKFDSIHNNDRVKEYNLTQKEV